MNSQQKMQQAIAMVSQVRQMLHNASRQRMNIDHGVVMAAGNQLLRVEHLIHELQQEIAARPAPTPGVPA